MSTRTLLGLAAAMLILAAADSFVHAQQPDEAATAVAVEEVEETLAEDTISPEKLAKLWGDLLHYIKIARGELALSYGKAILAANVDPRDLYHLSVDTPGAQATLVRGSRLTGMAETIAAIRRLIEQGYEAERSDPDEIAASIDALGGTLRGYELAKSRLQRSGEYAMPQLIQKLMDDQTSPMLRERIVALLPSMGKAAVRPLSVALQAKDDRFLEIVANALGRIEYYFAAPRLKELAERKGLLQRTRDVANAALIACAGREALNKSAAELFYQAALAYYDRAESLLPDARYDTANVWYWKEGLGLTYKPVPREIFCDVYAMRMARLTLVHDPEFYPAVGLWIAANLRKEADLPTGATDATRGENQPGAKYYALAGGPSFAQDVLLRALKDEDSAVAIGAIEALAQTAGAKSLVQPVAGGAQPLVQALSYPDRHVRFLAATSLVRALPAKRFEGYELVMPVLVEALRQTGTKTALLLAEDEAQRNSLKDAIRAAGYELIEQAEPTLALKQARDSAGVDVIVVGSKPDGREVLAMVRRDPALAALPMVVAAQTLRDLAELDARVVVIPAAAKPGKVADALSQAGTLAAGKPMTPQQASHWAVRAAKCIHELGLTGNAVYDISRTRGALADALGDTRAEVRLAAADALSVMCSAEAQQAIVKLALGPNVPEADRIHAFGALSASLRRHGNQLTDQLSGEILEIVTGDGTAPLREAAAEAMGAMNLPSDKVRALFMRTAGNG